MKNIWILFVAANLLYSCKSGNNTTGEQKAESAQVIDTNNSVNSNVGIEEKQALPEFYIIGTEPFWNFNINKDTCLFTFVSENMDSVYFTVDSFTLTSNNAAFYLKDKQALPAELKLLKTGKCSDGMSDNVYTYEASFLYKRLTLNGCGMRK